MRNKNMVKIIEVVKRNGKKELLDYEKINNVLLWACEKIKDVSASDVAMNAKLQIFDGITTDAIHNVLIRSAVDMISENSPNYQYVASNLLNFFIRKNIFGEQDNLPHLRDLIKVNIERGVYDKELLTLYTDEELDKINKLIKHNRDFNFTYAGLQQLIDKYLIKDRNTGQLYETPQYMYILVSMVLFQSYPKEERLNRVRSYYNDISVAQAISLPTPILCGVRTPTRQYSSCVLIDIDDTLDSIYASNTAIGIYTARRAGIGINSRIRAIGDTIRHGEVIHTGVVPFFRVFESTVRSCTQNGVRGGSATTHFPFWHMEIEDILVLKNNKGTDNNRVRKLDYSIQLCRLFYKRFIENGVITLFSPGDVVDLYDAFGMDNDLFEALYLKYEKKVGIRKKTIKARDLMNIITQERVGTGRIYIMNIDNANTYSSFTDKVNMSNLCQEITLPTSPIQHIDDGKISKWSVAVDKRYMEELKGVNQLDYYHKKNVFKGFDKKVFNITDVDLTTDKYSILNMDVEDVYGDQPAEIATCILSALNLGAIRTLDDIEGIMFNMVSGLDAVISLQDYPIWAAKKMLKRRSIGVGITNLAYYLAKNNCTYESPEALYLIDELFEYIQYYGIKASVELAKRFGPCEYFDRTKYSKGILPIDKYNKRVDKLVKREYVLDWEALRAEVLEFGMRNSTITALMPCESSSVVSNSSNGMEPIRSFVTVKKSKQGMIKMVVPELNRLKGKYQLAFDMKDNTGISNIHSVMQKWIDQGLSANHYYDFKRNSKMSLGMVATDILKFYQEGGKQLYYANSSDNKTDNLEDMVKEMEKKEVVVEEAITLKPGEYFMEDSDCAGGACAI